MTNAEDWTGVSEDAQLYENNYVSTLFGPWAPRVADVAGIASGDRVLDVGCADRWPIHDWPAIGRKEYKNRRHGKTVLLESR